MLRAVAAGNGGPLVFVSAFGVDGASFLSRLLPGFWLARYFTAKQNVEESCERYRDRYDNAVAFLGPDSARSLYPIVVRPAPMYSLTKYDVLPLLPLWNAAAALPFTAIEPMLPVDFVGEAIVGLLDAAWKSSQVDSSPALPLRVGANEMLRSYVPLSRIKPVGPLDTLTSGLASIARLPFGTDVAKPLTNAAPASRAAMALTLYDIEGCADCRRVREVITYLDLVCDIKPCAAGSRHIAEAARISGRQLQRPSFPFLVDAATDTQLFKSKAICEYLISRYGGADVTTPPNPVESFYASSGIQVWLPSVFRSGRGVAVEPRVRARDGKCPSASGSSSNTPRSPPLRALILYSYEGNQFCRLVREVLCELGSSLGEREQLDVVLMGAALALTHVTGKAVSN